MRASTSARSARCTGSSRRTGRSTSGGANCGTRLSLDDYVALVPELVVAARGRPVMVQPNAGSPELGEGGAVRYPTDPQAFAAAVPRLLAAGARIVGGCCGTGPAHIAAIATAASEAA